MTENATAAGEQYVPTAREASVIKRFHERRQKRPPTPNLKIEQTGLEARIMVDHADMAVGWALMMDALGFDDITLADLIIDQVCMLASKGGKMDQGKANAMLSIIRGIGPRDATEAVLATQMAAIHIATMTQADRLRRVETIQQQDSNSNALNKLARTFTAQMDTLKRYRSKGDQKVTVEHVHVHAGGQAVVGNVTHGGGGDQKKEDQPHAKQIADAREPAVPCDLEALGMSVPGSRGQGMVGVPAARRSGRPALRPVK